LAIFAIFIACLGLFGLASFSVKQRQKEIGIRKVLGQSVFKIILMFIYDVNKLILLSFVISIPISIYVLNKWLHNFAYHITIDWVLIFVSGILAFFVAIGTVIIHAYSLAVSNPVDSLRNE
ncbi:MAG: cell division protein FtsX, partial [Marinilabiliales bacterium]